MFTFKHLTNRYIVTFLPCLFALQNIEVICIYLVNHVTTSRLKTTGALLCLQFSNLGRPPLHSTWCLMGLKSPRWWIPAHVVSKTSSLGHLFVWLLWAFSQHGLGVVELHLWWRLDSGGANSRSHWAILILLMPETGVVSSLPDSLGQKQVTGQSRFKQRRQYKVWTLGKSALLGSPRDMNFRKYLSEVEKGHFSVLFFII